MCLQAGPFSDLYEWLAQDWLSKGKTEEALITCSRAAGLLPDWGKHHWIHSETLAKVRVSTGRAKYCELLAQRCVLLSQHASSTVLRASRTALLAFSKTLFSSSTLTEVLPKFSRVDCTLQKVSANRYSEGLHCSHRGRMMKAWLRCLMRCCAAGRRKGTRMSGLCKSHAADAIVDCRGQHGRGCGEIIRDYLDWDPPTFSLEHAWSRVRAPLAVVFFFIDVQQVISCSNALLNLFWNRMPQRPH